MLDSVMHTVVADRPSGHDFDTFRTFFASGTGIFGLTKPGAQLGGDVCSRPRGRPHIPRHRDAKRCAYRRVAICNLWRVDPMPLGVTNGRTIR